MSAPSLRPSSRLVSGRALSRAPLAWPPPSPLARKVCGEAGVGQRAPQGRSRSSRCRAAGAVDPGTRRFGAAARSSRPSSVSGAWGPAEKPAWATAWGDSAGRGRLLRDTPASEQVTKGSRIPTRRQLAPVLPEHWGSRTTWLGSRRLGSPLVFRSQTGSFSARVG